MTQLALSSMFAQQERFADGRTFAHWAAAAGFEAVELSHWTSRELGTAIHSAGVLPVCGVHAPAPLERDGRGVANSALNLASTDEAERRAAVGAAVASVRWAHELGARASVVHLGYIAADMPSLRELLRAVRERERPAQALDVLRGKAAAERETHAPPFLEAAARSLAEIMAVAEPLGVVVGLESRLGFSEIPSPEECAALLRPYPATAAGWWLDVGHVEVLHRLGLVDRGRWEACVGERLVGAHVHDVQGLRDHRAPGNGDVDWTVYAPLLRRLSSLTLEIDQREPDERVRDARAFLAAQGAVS